ncbi:hypothetical protein M2165_001453 [Variovorax sp. TBS-050B]|nr:hypothetical protein [Variovorax sp. TBS-050B]
MRRWTSMWFLAVLAAGLVGCSATGPRFSEMADSLPSLGENEGRIYFYRNSIMGAAVQPEVSVNGEVIGKSQPGSFFFIDRPPGTYKATARTEAEGSIDIVLRARQTAYVEMSISMGLLIGRPAFERVAEAEGRDALPSLAYGGKMPLPQRGLSATAAPPGPAPRQTATAAAAGDIPSTTAPAASFSAPRPRLVEYELHDRLTNIRRKVIYRADAVLDDEPLSFNGGGWVEKPAGEVVSITSSVAGEFDIAMPPGGWAKPNLREQGAWKTRYTSTLGATRINMDLSAAVMEDSTLNVGGREVKVVRIEYRGFTERFPNAGAVAGNQHGPYRAESMVLTGTRPCGPL